MIWAMTITGFLPGVTNLREMKAILAYDFAMPYGTTFATSS
jgi:hypothetical protein